MAKLTKVTGINNVLANLNKADTKLGKRFSSALKKGGLLLQRESQKIVPIQTGNLRASAFTRSFGNDFKTDVVVGYTANYAAYVHENLNAAHGKEFNRKHSSRINSASTPAQRKIWFRRGSDQQAKFLERPAREKRQEILALLYSMTKF